MVRGTFVAPLVVMLAGGLLAGCGESENFSAGAPLAQRHASKATAVSGRFTLVPKAPRGFKMLRGTAKLTRSDRGTDASIELDGLVPKVAYASHVHAGSCDQPDPGGPHFRFDLNGADTPPNEIHLPFTSDAAGSGTAKAHNNRAVPLGEGQSIVVHRSLAASSSSSSATQPTAAAGGAHHADDGSAKTTGSGTPARGHTHPPKVACAPLVSGDGADATGLTTAETKGNDASFAVAVEAKQPVGGVEQLKVSKGQRVRFTVTSDESEEVHTHGYDLSEPVGPGKPARFDFAATIEGIFEVELERSGVPILSLRVNP